MNDEDKTRQQLAEELSSLREELSKFKINADDQLRAVSIDAENALKESEERYRSIINSITDYVFTVWIRDGLPIKTTHGPACEAVTGYTTADYEKDSHLWYRMVYEEDIESVLEHAAQILSGKNSSPLEHRIIHKSGQVKWVRNTPVPHCDKGGRLASYDGVIVDITEYKKAEAVLRESEERYRSLFVNMLNGFAYCRMIFKNNLPVDFIYLEVNKAFEKLTGLKDVVGKRVTDVIPGIREADPELFEIYGRVATTGKPERFEMYVEAMRMWFWISVYSPAKEHFVAVFDVITERKEAEDALKNAKKEWEETFDAISDPIFIHDRELRVMRANTAYAKAAGMKFEELIGTPYHEVYPKMDRPFNICLNLTELQGDTEEEFSCPVTNRIFKNRFYPIKDADGNHLYSVHIMEDVTEAKRTTEQYKIVVQTAMDGFWMTDTQGRILDVNDAYCQMMGYRRDEMLTMSIPDLEAAEAQEETSRHVHRIIENGWDRFESRHKHKDGRIIDIEASVNYMKIDDGRFFVFIRDITERKKAEEKIKEEMEITSHLLMIAEATAHATDIEELMAEVVHCGHEAIRCDICLSYLWNGEAKLFLPRKSTGLNLRMIPLFMSETLDNMEQIIKKAIKEKEPVIIQAGKVDVPLLTWIDGINTIAVIPLAGKQGDLGLIIGVYLKDVEITERDIKIMRGISHQVSSALEQARLYKESVDHAMELSHKIETIRVMNEIDRSILSTLEPQVILETVLRMIAKVIICDSAVVALVEKERGGFIFMAGFNASTGPNCSFVKFEDTNALEIMEYKRPQYIADLMDIKEPLPREKEIISNGFLSLIRMPLISKGEVAGILAVMARRPSAYTPEDLSTLEKLAAQIGVALENARLITDLEELFIGTVKSLSSAIDAKSPWTSGHSERVTRYAVEIGKTMGFSEKELKNLELVGLLHDIGKIGTYESILDKPGRLTEEEYMLMKQHPGKGAEILAPIRQMQDFIAGVKHHHENYDGTGYPDGLKGEQIPLFARILSVADSVDAMGADRPYRAGRPMDVIVAELKRCSGAQFDPKVVEAFLKTIPPSS